MSICNIENTNEFKNLVDNIRYVFGDSAEIIAMKNYLANNNMLLTPAQVIAQEKAEFFPPIFAKLRSGSENELSFSKRQIFQDLGYKGSMKRIISNEQLINLRESISKKNNFNYANNIDIVYTLPSNEIEQQGQSDNFTYKIRVFKGKLDIEGKVQKVLNNKNEDNRLASDTERNTLYTDLFGTSPSTEELALEATNLVTTTLTLDEQDTTVGTTILDKLANFLNNVFGVEYEWLSEEKARELTKDKKNPYQNEPAFFMDGRIYLVKGKANKESVFHEFSHPFFRAIQNQNKELFDNLYYGAISSNAGRDIWDSVKENYPELEEGSDLFKEEVLVQAFTQMSKEPQSPFAKFYKDVMYAIKTMLRKIFGKTINLDKLSNMTTLEELLEMVSNGTKFDIDTDSFDSNDIIAYQKEYTKQFNDMFSDTMNVKQIETLTNEFFDKAAKHINTLNKQGKYKELEKIIGTEAKGALYDVKNNLKGFQSSIQNDALKITDEIELTKLRVSSILNSSNILGNMLERIYTDLKELISKNIDGNPEELARVYYYKQQLDTWKDFLENADSVLKENDVELPMITKARGYWTNSNSILQKYYANTIGDIIFNQVKGVSEQMELDWNKRKEELKRKNVSQTQIDNEEKAFKADLITLDSVKNDLMGKAGDVSVASAYLEAASYSNDTIVGGFAKLVRDKLKEAEALAQATVNRHASELKPLLEAVGISPTQVGQLLPLVAQKEKRLATDPETGKSITTEVWQFINEFTGFEEAEANFKIKIAEAKEIFEKTGTEKDKLKLLDIQNEYSNWTDTYKYQIYTDAYLKTKKLFQDDVGKKAKEALDILDADMKSMQNPLLDTATELERLDILSALQRQRKALYSLYDDFGNEKIGDDLEIAKRLQQYSEMTKGMYNSEYITNSFESALNNFTEKLLEDGYTQNTEEFYTRRNLWIEQNTTVKPVDDYYDIIKDVNERIAFILKKLPQDEQIELDITQATKDIQNILKAHKDESNQPLGGEMSEESLAKLKEAVVRLETAREKLTKPSGLTKVEQAKYEKYLLIQPTTTKEQAEFQLLINKMRFKGLSSIERATLRGLYAKLGELRSNEATDDYVDIVNGFVRQMEGKPAYDMLKITEFNKQTVNFLTKNEELLNEMFKELPAFESWFKNNHIAKTIYNPETEQMVDTWQKTYAWSMVKPSSEDFLQKFEIKDKKGNVIETLNRVPNMKYYRREVKEVYENEKGEKIRLKTEKILGKTIDNRGNFLPKKTADNRYTNKAYLELKNRDINTFNLLEKLKEIHLYNQNSIHPESRLYLDVPRFAKGGLERAQDKSPLSRFKEGARRFYTKAKDSWDRNFNFEYDKQLYNVELLERESIGVPIQGLSNLDSEEVSGDIISSMMRYMLSGAQQNALVNLIPTAKALQFTVANAKPMWQSEMKTGTIINPNRKKERYVRQKALDNYIAQTFEGERNVGWGSDSAIAQNISKGLFKQASFAYLALDIPSAIKNAISAKFQGLVESASGKYFGFKEFMKAEGIATKTMAEISTQVYSTDSKSLLVQMVELFDPERERFKNNIGKSITYTPLKAAMKPLERLTDFRRWTQLQSNLQIFFAYMNSQKIPMGDKMIKYTDAWEIKNNVLQLKEGIDPKYGITYDAEGKIKLGSEFVKYRNQSQRVIDNLNGAMSNEERSEADRYLLFRYISFFRKFLGAQIINRFGYKGGLFASNSGRYDYQLGDVKQGFYITVLKSLKKVMEYGPRYLLTATPEEKQAYLRLMTEVGVLLIMSSLLGPLFGWDGDDEDRFEKLKAKSGPFPSFFVEDDPNRPFSFEGWLSNHALMMMSKVRAENDQFLPFPGLGLNDYKEMLDLKSIVFGPTLKNYLSAVQSLGYLATGDDKAYYKKDVGPYEWQKEDETKLWNYIGKSIGISGSSLDPATSFKTFQNIQNK